MVDDDYKVIRPACPKCGVDKLIKIPRSVFEQKSYGFVKIQVPKGAVCKEHQFLVISDNQARIIGYEAIDKAISLQEEEREVEVAKERVKDLKFTLRYLINKFGFNSVAGFIHAKLFKYETYIVRSDEPEINIDDLNDYFDKMMPENYRNSVKITTINYDKEIYTNPGYFYSLVQNQKTNAYLLNPRRHVIQMPWRTEIEYETNAINYALQKEDPNEQYKIIVDSILRFIHDSEYAEKKLNEVKKKISERTLIKELDESLSLSTINKERMNIIKEFLYRRKSPDLVKKIK